MKPETTRWLLFLLVGLTMLSLVVVEGSLSEDVRAKAESTERLLNPEVAAQHSTEGDRQRNKEEEEKMKEAQEKLLQVIEQYMADYPETMRSREEMYNTKQSLVRLLERGFFDRIIKHLNQARIYPPDLKDKILHNLHSKQPLILDPVFERLSVLPQMQSLYLQAKEAEQEWHSFFSSIQSLSSSLSYSLSSSSPSSSSSSSPSSCSSSSFSFDCSREEKNERKDETTDKPSEEKEKEKNKRRRRRNGEKQPQEQKAKSGLKSGQKCWVYAHEEEGQPWNTISCSCAALCPAEPISLPTLQHHLLQLVEQRQQQLHLNSTAEALPCLTLPAAHPASPHRFSASQPPLMTTTTAISSSRGGDHKQQVDLKWYHHARCLVECFNAQPPLVGGQEGHFFNLQDLSAEAIPVVLFPSRLAKEVPKSRPAAPLIAQKRAAARRFLQDVEGLESTLLVVVVDALAAPQELPSQLWSLNGTVPIKLLANPMAFNLQEAFGQPAAMTSSYWSEKPTLLYTLAQVFERLAPRSQLVAYLEDDMLCTSDYYRTLQEGSGYLARACSQSAACSPAGLLATAPPEAALLFSPFLGDFLSPDGLGWLWQPESLTATSGLAVSRHLWRSLKANAAAFCNSPFDDWVDSVQFMTVDPRQALLPPAPSLLFFVTGIPRVYQPVCPTAYCNQTLIERDFFYYRSGVEKLREEHAARLKRELEMVEEEVDFDLLSQAAHSSNLHILQVQDKVNGYGLPLQLTPTWRRDPFDLALFNEKQAFVDACQRIIHP